MPHRTHSSILLFKCTQVCCRRLQEKMCLTFEVRISAVETEEGSGADEFRLPFLVGISAESEVDCVLDRIVPVHHKSERPRASHDAHADENGVAALVDLRLRPRNRMVSFSRSGLSQFLSRIHSLTCQRCKVSLPEQLLQICDHSTTLLVIMHD